MVDDIVYKDLSDVLNGKVRVYKAKCCGTCQFCELSQTESGIGFCEKGYTGVFDDCVCTMEYCEDHRWRNHNKTFRGV